MRDEIKRKHHGSAEVLDTPAGRIYAPSQDKAPLLDEWMTEAEFAREIGRTPRTIARWRALGEAPPHIKIGREIKYRRSTARAWLVGLETDE